MTDTHSIQKEQFAACLGCIDGRTTEPVLLWIQTKFGVAYVDRINRPGMDGLLCGRSYSVWHTVKAWFEKRKIKKELLISIHHHNAHTVFVAGHCECAGNPVSEEEHKNCVMDAVVEVRSWNLPGGVEIVGLLVNTAWRVEEVHAAVLVERAA